MIVNQMFSLSHSGVGDICFANQNRQGGINIRKHIRAKVPEMRYCSVFSCDDFKTIWFDFVSVKSLRRPLVTHSPADQRAQVAVVSQKLNALEIVVSQKVSL